MSTTVGPPASRARPGLTRHDPSRRATEPTYVVRCATLPVTVYGATLEDLPVLEHLRRLWDPALGLREPVTLASPTLARELGRVVDDGTPVEPRRAARLRATLVQYAIRAATRATPFGTFAGVAALRPGGDGPLRLVSGHRRHVRLDPTQVEQDASPLVAHPSAHVRGDRLAIPVRVAGEQGHTSSSVRWTGAVEKVLGLCGDGRTRDELVALLAVEYPDQPTGRLGQFVDELVRHEALVPAGRSLFADPAAAVGVTPDLRAAVDAYAATRPGDGALALGAVQRASAAGRPLGGERARAALHVDLEMQVRGTVPPDLAPRVGSVLRVLGRTTLLPASSAVLTRWTERFEERYGTSLVPLLSAVDHASGLGLPPEWTEPAGSSGHDVGGDATRAARLAGLRGILLERARTACASAVEILDADLVDLEEPEDWASSYDVFVELRQGPQGVRYALTPVAVNFPGGRAGGRFTHGADELRSDVAQWVEHDVARHPGAVVADVDCLVGRTAVNLLASTAPVHPATVTVTGGADGARATVRLSDLHLAVRGHRLGLYLADGSPVEPRQLSMVTPDSYPPLVRLVLELGAEGFVRPAWTWGAVEDTLLHLPEVAYAGVVLAEQRWRWPGGSPTVSGVRRWLSASGVSRWVRVGALDNRLHLDTASTTHLELFVAELRAGTRWIHEAPSPDDLGVVGSDVGRHAGEIVVTVPGPCGTSTGRERAVGRLLDTSDAYRSLDVGSEWTYVTVDAPVTAHGDLVADLATALEAHPWYFVRYVEAGRGQLRLRAHAPLRELDDLFDALAGLRRGHRAGPVAVRSYERELERYGGAASFRVWEQAFCAESRALVVTGAPTRRLADDLDTAAGLVLAWVTAVAPDTATADDLLDVACEGYVGELGADAHELKRAARGQRPVGSGSADAVDAALRGLWSRPDARSGDRGVDVLQSALHLFCNRLGLDRREEFSVLQVVRAHRRAEVFRGR